MEYLLHDKNNTYRTYCTSVPCLIYFHLFYSITYNTGRDNRSTSCRCRCRPIRLIGLRVDAFEVPLPRRRMSCLFNMLIRRSVSSFRRLIENETSLHCELLTQAPREFDIGARVTERYFHLHSCPFVHLNVPTVHLSKSP